MLKKHCVNMNVLIYIIISYIHYTYSCISSCPRDGPPIFLRDPKRNLLQPSWGPLSQALTAALQQTKLSWMVDSYIPWHDGEKRLCFIKLMSFQSSWWYFESILSHDDNKN